MKRSPLKRGAPLGRRRRLKPRATPDKQGRPDPAVDDVWRHVHDEVADRWWCEADTPACPTGRHRGAHAHHVILRSRGGPDEAWNLLWVCIHAHDWIHRNPAAATERGLMRSRTTL